MSTLDKFVGGALVLIAIFLMVNPQNKGNEILNTLFSGGSRVFQTLQGR